MRSSLRFAVGEPVECHYDGGFVRGIVTQHHYTHPALGTLVAPYQVRLLDGTNRLIFARFDDDATIRRAAPVPAADERPPRFRVGDRVQVRFDGDDWMDAWVTQLWYSQPAESLAQPWTRQMADGKIVLVAPYQVRLASPAARHPLHFVPVDDDRRIRRVAQEPPRPPLRFAEGDAVECRMEGRWAPGTVRRLWYTHAETDLRKPLTEYHPGRPEGQRILLCAPYQVELLETSEWIYAPRDHDDSIRALAAAPALREEPLVDDTGVTGVTGASSDPVPSAASDAPRAPSAMAPPPATEPPLIRWPSAPLPAAPPPLPSTPSQSSKPLHDYEYTVP